jgi:hypothetical protein
MYLVLQITATCPVDGTRLRVYVAPVHALTTIESVKTAAPRPPGGVIETLRFWLTEVDVESNVNVTCPAESVTPISLSSPVYWTVAPDTGQECVPSNRFTVNVTVYVSGHVLTVTLDDPPQPGVIVLLVLM